MGCEDTTNVLSVGWSGKIRFTNEGTPLVEIIRGLFKLKTNRKGGGTNFFSKGNPQFLGDL